MTTRLTKNSAPFRRSTLVLAVIATLALAPLAGPIDARAANERPAFADLVAENSPAVVNIRSTIRRADGARPGMRSPQAMPGTPFDEFFRRFFEQMPQGSDPNQMPRGHGGEAVGQGSGFIISADGHIVTNHHVIENASEIAVLTSEGDSYDATLVGADPKTDLALLKIEAEEKLPHLRFGDSDAARAGDWVLAIGNPFGLGGSATAGIISARGRDLRAGPYDDFLQIDAPINRGNSGGPVFNDEGEVIGVNTMIYSPNGGNVGIGFAIPSNLVAGIVEDLQQNGEVERGWLGVQIQTVTPELAEGLGLDRDAGALIAAVEPDSPADEAGLRAGDVVVEFDGKDVDTVRDLTRLVADAKIARSLEVGVWREGERTERQVRIGRLDDEPVRVAATGAAEPGRLGLELAPLTEEKRRQFRIPEAVDGALVVGVDPRGPAAREGLRPGDVISMVGKQSVSSANEVREALDGLDEDAPAVFRIERNGGSRFVAMKLA